MKLFKTNAIDTVKVCQEYFINFELPSVVIEKRKKDFSVTSVTSRILDTLACYLVKIN